MQNAAAGHLVTVHYTGRLDSGEVFDSSEGGDPLKFVIGRGSVIPGFENALVGMEIGQEKKVSILPVDAYGDRDPRRMTKIPRDRLDGAEPEIGMQLQVQMSNGHHAIAVISEVGKEEITIDLNHPLAGQTLHFVLNLLGIEDGANFVEEEHCCGHGEGGCGHDHDSEEGEGCCGHGHDSEEGEGCCGKHGDKCCS